MSDNPNTLGRVNTDQPLFLDDQAIEKIMSDFADWSMLEKFYLVGGTVVDRLFYPQQPISDIDICIFNFEDYKPVLHSLKRSGTVLQEGSTKRNLVSSAKYIRFLPADKSIPYDIAFLEKPMFVGQFSPECPLIEYPSGSFIEQGTFLKAHQEKTVEMIRNFDEENKQDLLMRFIHTVCKYDFPLDTKTTQATLTSLRQSFAHRDDREFHTWQESDRELIEKVKKAAARPNKSWQDMKEALIKHKFNDVLALPVWEVVLSC